MSELNDRKDADERHSNEELSVADLEPREEIQGGSSGIHQVTDVTLKRGVID